MIALADSGKFKGGQLVLTAGVNDMVAQDSGFAKFVTDSLSRHFSGDWGDLSKQDKMENEFSLDKHLRIFSAYKWHRADEMTGEIIATKKIWIITEANRESTCVLFPEEY